MNILLFDIFRLHFWWNKGYRDALQIFKQNPFEVVHCHDLSSLPIGIKLKKKATFKEIIDAFKEAGWSLGIPVIIIGGIYGGIFTPTEAAGIAAAYAMFVALFIYREINLKKLLDVAFESALGTAQIMIILAGASVFAWFLTRHQVPGQLAEMLISFGSSKFFILLIMNIILLILCDM